VKAVMSIPVGERENRGPDGAADAAVLPCVGCHAEACPWDEASTWEVMKPGGSLVKYDGGDKGRIGATG